MRQKLVSWLIEDIAPAVRKNRDPEDTILKFAKEKNLEPALVQGLGQLFNTAKTLAYLEKSANKGDNFPLLDVDAMLDKYLEVRPKSAAVKGESAYDQFGCGEPGLPEFFKNIPGLNVEPEETYEEKTVKLASRRPATLREISELNQSVQNIEQVRADLIEDCRVLLQKSANTIKQGSLNFQTIERDALGLYGNGIKPVTDLLAHHCDTRNVKVARATDGGKPRMIRDNEAMLRDLNTVSEKLELVKCANGLLAETQEEQQHAVNSNAKKVDHYSRRPDNSFPITNPMELEVGNGKKPKGTAPSTEKQPTSEKAAPVSTGKVLMDAGTKAIEPLRKLPEYAEHFRKTLGGVNNTDQQHVDNAYEEAKHISVLQNLLTTDDVLAEADPEHVVSMYNTLRRLSPQMASDPNVVRVALRTMIQHDGISPFDAKSFLETEQAHQKTDFNKRLLDSMDYKGVNPSPSPKPQ
jgi:hypothetical protein